MSRSYKPATLLDTEFYRSHHPDLRAFSDDVLDRHYSEFGIKEGRPGIPGATRDSLLESIPRHGLALEIGPYCRPSLTGAHVRYADVFSTAELRARAEFDSDMDPEHCPEIHYNLSNTRLKDITERFVVIFSSHCIEHQPNFVGHLNDVHDILLEGGQYIAIVPDKRYCFDHFRPESTLTDVVAASVENRVRHDTRTLLSHAALVTHNECGRHWAGDHGRPAFELDKSCLENAIWRVGQQTEAYMDAHAWQLTPYGFSTIVEQLQDLGLLKLKVEAVFETPANRHEFCVIFRKD